jgi:hypothetical protein
MGFPGHEQDSPQRVSAAVNTAGFAQDVVMATSRLIHGQDLTARDRQTLEDCRDLLQRLVSTDVSFSRPREHQLAATNTVALIRKARSADPLEEDELKAIISAIDRLLDGERDAVAIDGVQKLRATFLAVGEGNLAAMTRPESEDEVSGRWTDLIANSTS